jgi:nicotinamide-nucleotide amidase
MGALQPHASKVIKLASAAHVTLATVEPRTAGALAVLLADAPGAADTLHGGFIVYTKQNKISAIGVPASLITAHSAVSAEVAKEIARGALERCPADITIAITGVAGPEPDEDGNPLGLVYVAAAVRGSAPEAVACSFGKRHREEIRDSMEAALRLVATLLDRLNRSSKCEIAALE